MYKIPSRLKQEIYRLKSKKMESNPSPAIILKLDALISKTVSGPTIDVKDLDMVINYPNLER